MATHSGRTAVVTGAARGIGQAIAIGLAGRGARVAVLDIDDGGETVHRIEDDGGEGMAHTVDLTDQEAIRDAVVAVRDRFGPVDILVNNAGISNSGPLLDVSVEQWRRTMSINLDAPFLLVREVAPDMIRKRWGRIVNVASSSIYTTAPDKVPYMASKAGVLGMTCGLANDLGKFGITANAVSPGLTMTAMLAAQVEDGRISRDLVQEMWAKQAIPHQTDVRDLVGPVLFLTGEDSAMVTGQFITADGGISHHF